MIHMVSVIVLNRNGRVQIEKCLPAVLGMDYPDYEVIFVDNGSDDGSLELARGLAANSHVPCTFLPLGENQGYCRGKNAGAAAAKGEYLWLLDNDIEPDADTLTKLVGFMAQHPDVALCGPAQVDYEHRDKVVGGGFRMGLFRQPRLRNDVLRAPEGLEYVSYITGGVMFIRRAVWEQLGGFEPSGQFFLDDNDFGPRCWLAGWKVALVHGCVARHLQISRASHSYWRWRLRNFAPGIVRGMVRNYTWPALLVALPAFLVFLALKALKNAVWRRDPRILADAAASVVCVLKGCPKSLRQRRQVQKLRTVRGNPFLHP